MNFVYFKYLASLFNGSVVIIFWTTVNIRVFRTPKESICKNMKNVYS